MYPSSAKEKRRKERQRGTEKRKGKKRKERAARKRGIGKETNSESYSVPVYSRSSRRTCCIMLRVSRFLARRGHYELTKQRKSISIMLAELPPRRRR